MYELQNKYNKYKVLHLLISYSICMYELQNKYEVLHLLNSSVYIMFLLTPSKPQ